MQIDNKCIYSNGNDCEALVDKACAGCKFKKTKAQADEAIKYVYGLISNKPVDEQRQISKKYYRGQQPWWEGAK